MDETMRSIHMQALQEGNPASALRAAIALIGNNRDVDIRLGTVVSPSPLRIQIDGMKIELEADDFVVDRSLTDYDVMIRYGNGSSETVTIMNALQAGDRVYVSERGQTYYVIGRAVTYGESAE